MGFERKKSRDRVLAVGSVAEKYHLRYSQQWFSAFSFCLSVTVIPGDIARGEERKYTVRGRSHGAIPTGGAISAGGAIPTVNSLLAYASHWSPPLPSWSNGVSFHRLSGYLYQMLTYPPPLSSRCLFPFEPVSYSTGNSGWRRG